MSDKKFGPWIKRRKIQIDIEVLMKSGSDPVLFNATGGVLHYDSLGNDKYRIWSKDEITRLDIQNERYRNPNLLDITVYKGSSLTSLENFLFPDGSGTLYDCSAVENIIFDANCSVNKLTTLKKAFYYAGRDSTNLVFDISNIDTKNVTNFFSCFDSIDNCTELNLSDWSFLSASEMGYMFRSSEFKSIQMPLDMTSVKPVANMTNLFYGCNQLECLNLLDTTNATDTSDMFYDCGNLTAPDSTDQTNLINGASWVNPDSCPNT